MFVIVCVLFLTKTNARSFYIDFSDEDLIRMTKLTQSYFEMMNVTTGYGSDDDTNNNTNRYLQDDAMLMNCTYEEELSCSTGTILSSFLLLTNYTD